MQIFIHSFTSSLEHFPLILLQGGLVKAGLDVAQMWLDGDETLVNTIDGNGNMLPITVVNGHGITHDPLVVIVSTNFSCLMILTLAFSSTIFELATKK